jgi:hypothetical protein
MSMEIKFVKDHLFKILGMIRATQKGLAGLIICSDNRQNLLQKNIFSKGANKISGILLF